MNSVSPVRVFLIIMVVSFAFGLSILFSFKPLPIEYVVISNGTTTRITLYENMLDFNNPILVYISIFALVISNQIFFVVLIVINILLYIELRKLMKKKQKLVKG